MTQVLTGLAVIAGYALFLYFKPGQPCRRCKGWGMKAKRRRSGACSKCTGTGIQFRPGARFVHSAVTLAVKSVREHREGQR